MSEYGVLGIDPGKSGGMAVALCGESPAVVEAEAFRAEINASTLIKIWKERYNITRAVMENVHAFPGQGVVSAFSFGENFGFWKGLLAAHDIRVEFVEPRVWQKSLGVRLPGHVQKTAHKNALKNLAAERNPHLKVSLATADAILIASYGSRIA